MIAILLHTGQRVELLNKAVTTRRAHLHTYNTKAGPVKVMVRDHPLSYQEGTGGMEPRGEMRDTSRQPTLFDLAHAFATKPIEKRTRLVVPRTPDASLQRELFGPRPQIEPVQHEPAKPWTPPWPQGPPSQPPPLTQGPWGYHEIRGAMGKPYVLVSSEEPIEAEGIDLSREHHTVSGRRHEKLLLETEAKALLQQRKAEGKPVSYGQSVSRERVTEALQIANQKREAEREAAKQPAGTYTVFRGRTQSGNAGAAHGIGTYYGLDQHAAELFSQPGTVQQHSVSVRTPAIVRSDAELRTLKEAAERETGLDFGKQGNLYEMLRPDQASAFTRWMKKRGHDSLIIDYPEAAGGRQLVTFPSAEETPQPVQPQPEPPAQAQESVTAAESSSPDDRIAREAAALQAIAAVKIPSAEVTYRRMGVRGYLLHNRERGTTQYLGTSLQWAKRDLAQRLDRYAQEPAGATPAPAPKEPEPTPVPKKEPWQMTKQEAGVGEPPQVPDPPRSLKLMYGERGPTEEQKQAHQAQISARSKALRAYKAHVERSNAHFWAVEAALREGKPVPAHVAAEYGEMAERVKREREVITSASLYYDEVGGKWVPVPRHWIGTQASQWSAKVQVKPLTATGAMGKYLGKSYKSVRLVLFKSHVRGHYRTEPSGKRTFVRDYEDSRQKQLELFPAAGQPSPVPPKKTDAPPPSPQPPAQYRVTSRREVPEQKTWTNIAGEQKVEKYVHGGSKAVCVVLPSGHRAWGFGGTWEEAEADAVTKARALAPKEEAPAPKAEAPAPKEPQPAPRHDDRTYDIYGNELTPAASGVGTPSPGHFVRDREADKLTLHFTKQDFDALSEADKRDIRGAFLWSSARRAWVSRGKLSVGGWAILNAEQIAKRLKLEDKGEEGERRSFAEQQARQAERASERVAGLSTAAEKRDAEAQRRWKASEKYHGDTAFNTQPGYIPERARVNRSDEKAYELSQEAKALRMRAFASSDTATQANLADRGFLQRRIDQYEAEIRGYDREITQYTSNGGAPESPYVQGLNERKADAHEKLDYYKGHLEKLGGVSHSQETVKVGDFVKVRHGWGAVTSAGPKNVKVDTMHGVTLTYPYAEITDHRTREQFLAAASPEVRAKYEAWEAKREEPKKAEAAARAAESELLRQQASARIPKAKITYRGTGGTPGFWLHNPDTGRKHYLHYDFASSKRDLEAHLERYAGVPGVTGADTITAGSTYYDEVGGKWVPVPPHWVGDTVGQHEHRIALKKSVRLVLVKSHVRGHYRTEPTGKRTFVRDYDDSRQQQLELFPTAGPRLVLPATSRYRVVKDSNARTARYRVEPEMPQAAPGVEHPVPAPKAEAPAPKAPWQMTRQEIEDAVTRGEYDHMMATGRPLSEYARNVKNAQGNIPLLKEATRRFAQHLDTHHGAAVVIAHAEGKDVSEENRKLYNIDDSPIPEPVKETPIPPLVLKSPGESKPEKVRTEPTHAPAKPQPEHAVAVDPTLRAAAEAVHGKQRGLTPAERGQLRMALGMESLLEGATTARTASDSLLVAHYLQRTGGTPAKAAHTAVAEPKAPRLVVPKVGPTGAEIASGLRKRADAMSAQIDAKMNPAILNQNTTARRARIGGHILQEGERLESIQRTLRALADMHENGSIPEVLKGIRTRGQVETLRRTEAMPTPGVHKERLNDMLKDMQGKPGVAEMEPQLQRILARAPDSYRAPLTPEDETLLRKFAAMAKEHGTARYFAQDILDDLSEAKGLRELGITSQEAYHEARGHILRLGVPADVAERERKKQLREAENALIGTQIPDFFATPRPVINEMLEYADIQPGDEVLEPSAGKGDIADAVRELHPDAKLSTIEIAHSLKNILKLKGHTVVGDDFLEHTGKQYDKIIMNPPFSKGADADHVRHAFELLRPNGKLISVMSEGTFFRDDKKAQEFRDWLTSVGGRSEQMPEGSFTGPESFRQTGVRTRLVRIAKAALNKGIFSVPLSRFWRKAA